MRLGLLIKRLRCHHNYAWVRNIYGDMINMCNGMRSEWRCVDCGKWTLRPNLEPER